MNWELITIGEHCTVTSSKRFHLSERCKDGIPFYCSKEIIQKVNGQEVTDCDYISEEVYEQVKKQFGVPETGDLLITTRGTYGIPYIYSKTDRFYFADGNLTWLKEFDKYLLPQYLYFWVLSYEGQKKIDAIAKGTAQKAVPIASIKSISLRLPCIRIQQKIVDILSAYDDLIENNRKQIKLLEEAAQRLYKEWFVDLRFPGWETTEIVDGVPVGWKKVPVGQLGEYLNGFAFKPTDWEAKGKPIIKIKEMMSGVTKDTPRNNGERVPNKYLVTAGDILFSWSATLCAIIWSDEDGWLNQHLFKVTPHDGIAREFVLQSIKNTLEEFSNLTTGSTMKHIQRGKLEKVYVNLPNRTIMRLYAKLSESIREKILTLSQQVNNAQEARDRLLPKLMSRELEV